MFLFSVSRDVTIDAWQEGPEGDVRTRRVLRCPGHGQLSADTVYVATPLEIDALVSALGESSYGEVFRVFSERAAANVVSRPGMPRRLGFARDSGARFTALEDQLADFDPTRAFRLAIINIFSVAFGDSVQCLTLLRALRAKLETCFQQFEVDLFQARFSTATNPIYARSGLVHRLRCLPVSLAQFASYDAYLDLSADHVRSDVPWIDGCLEEIAIRPSEIPDEWKRSRVTVDSTIAESVAPAIRAAREAGRPLLLVHPLASARIRSMPPRVVQALLTALLEQTEYTVAFAVSAPFAHERIADWSHAAETFDHLVALISNVDCFISVDTSVYHVADAFNVPGVVLFTSIPPDRRIRYYPYIEGVHVQPENRLSGKHFSSIEEDQSYADAMWDSLDLTPVFAALDVVTRRRIATHETSYGNGWTSRL